MLRKFCSCFVPMREQRGQAVVGGSRRRNENAKPEEQQLVQLSKPDSKVDPQPTTETEFAASNDDNIIITNPTEVQQQEGHSTTTSSTSSSSSSSSSSYKTATCQNAGDQCHQDRSLPPELRAKVEDLAGVRLDRCLGRGGFGQVFLATNRTANQPAMIAVKVILPPPLRAQEKDVDHRRQRIDAELRLLNLLSSGSGPENLVRFYGHSSLDTEGLAIALKMELLEIDLYQVSMTLKGLSIDEVRRLMVGVATGLAWLHSRGWVHHDLKPMNIMLAGSVGKPSEANPTRAAVPKLIDFGMSKHYQSRTDPVTGSTRVEVDGYRPGTPYYVCPQKLPHNGKDKPYDPFKADAYAMGKSSLVALYGKSSLVLRELEHKVKGRVEVLFSDPPDETQFKGQLLDERNQRFLRLSARMVSASQEDRITVEEFLRLMQA